MKKLLFTCLFLFLGFICILANNIVVSNISLTGQNTENDFTMVQFDLSWNNSWRDESTGSGSAGGISWDAAWVFVKYSTDGITWNHAFLNNDGHTSPGCIVQIGLVDETTIFNPITNPVVGAFVHRDTYGVGPVSPGGIKLRWNYGNNGVSDNAVVDVRVFAIEMVYVPEGPFYIGTGANEENAFYTFPNTTNPYLVTSEDAINVGVTTGFLYYPISNIYGGDRNGPIPAAYPKGYAGFYMMKYELSQQAYVDFLNTLPTDAAFTRFPNRNTNRNGIVLNSTTGLYETNLPFVACNYLSWDDGTAYADWAGLRPFTELEYEKACRGPLTPVANEYAWGTNVIAMAGYTLSNAGAANEVIANNYNTTGIAGNASYATTNGTINGPLRCGIFAAHTSNSGRVTSGASYYGIYELSGNLSERTVSVGNIEGRSFTGLHGNGSLGGASHNVSNWPDGNSALGAGFRGGYWDNIAGRCRVSDRNFATGYFEENNPSLRYYIGGFRLSRSLSRFVIIIN